MLDDSGSQQPKKRIAIIYDYDRMEDYLGEWKLRKSNLQMEKLHKKNTPNGDSTGLQLLMPVILKHTTESGEKKKRNKNAYRFSEGVLRPQWRIIFS